MDYNQLFCAALQKVLDSYEKSEIQFLNESDLQSYLFSECASLMRQNGFPQPLKVFAERGVFDKRKKIDLVLGDNEVLVELKFEPVWAAGGQGRVFTTIRDAGGIGYGSVEEDLQKIEHYAGKGKHAHFVMIDENGWHPNKIEQGKWSQVKNGKNTIFLLHVYRKPVT